MPRFVILQHDAPQGTHFDFMLETGDVLRTWSLPKTPTADATLIGEALPDHRPAYLDYEGPISGGRGNVVRWDFGTFDWDRSFDAENTLAIKISGQKISGRVVLCRMENSSRWQFSFHILKMNHEVLKWTTETRRTRRE
jgi:hypothetical protein